MHLRAFFQHLRAVILPIFLLLLALVCVFQVSRLSTRSRIKALTSSVQDYPAFDLNKHHELVKVSWYPESTASEIYCLRGDKVRRTVQVESSAPHLIYSSNENQKGNLPTNIAFRYFSPEQPGAIFESQRSYLDHSLWPVSSDQPPVTAKVPITLPCPSRDKAVRVEVQLVQESNAWQQDVSDKTHWAVGSLIPQSANEMRARISGKFTDATKVTSVKLQGLNSEELRVVRDARAIGQTLLNLNLLELESNSLRYLAFDAGSQYSQVWVRDMASVQKALIRYGWKIGPGESHWADLFFAQQSEPGEIVDWVSPYPNRFTESRDKNDVQSDQELWLIIGALEAVRDGAVPIGWISQVYADKTREQRLIDALRWLLKSRWEKKEGCVSSGHTADWGDVGLTGTDDRTSTKRAHGAPPICGIFLSALLSHAIDLVEKYLNPNVVRTNLDLIGLNLAEIKVQNRSFANSLWSEEGGYFRIHKHIDGPGEHTFDESKMFALGGNTLAAEYGLASKVQAARIVGTILRLQKEQNLPTVGFVLLPPYPEGTYENPIMNSPFEYQNGGDWDWYGLRAAKLIYAFNPDAGSRALYEIAAKIVANGTFYEWTKQNGSPGEGPHYRASVGEWWE